MIVEIQYENGISEKINTDKTSVIIGRSTEADVRVVAEGISRKHVKVDYEGNKFYLTDLASANGVYVGDDRLTPSEKVFYPSILPFKIGTVSILVSEEEIDNAPDKADFTQVTSINELKSVKMGDASKKKAPTAAPNPLLKKKKGSGKSDKSNMPMLLVSVFVFLGVLYFFAGDKLIGTDKNAETAQKIVETNKTAPIATSFKKELDKIEFMSPLNISDLVKNSTCASDFADYCNSLKHEAAVKGAVKVGEQLLLFIDLSKAESFYQDSPSFLKLPEARRYKILLTYWASSPKLIQLAHKSKLHLIVAGFVTTDGNNIYGNMCTMPLKQAAYFDPKDHEVIFNYALIGGDDRLFKKYLEENVLCER